MKHVSLVAAALLLGAGVASAQPTDVPEMKCENKPQMPGSRMMEDRTIRTRFEREMKTYEACVKGYVNDRNAAAKAHADAVKANNDAAKKAVDDYNVLLKSVNEAQSGK